MLDDLDVESETIEANLVQFIKRLEQARNEVDFKLKKAISTLRTLQGIIPVPDDPAAEVRITRLSRREAERRRREAGQAVYSAMASQPSGRMFTFGQLKEYFSQDIAFMWPQIQSQWNQDHPDKQIMDNGLPKARRRYYLGLPK